MFGALRNRLKSVISGISKEIEEKGKEELKEAEPEPKSEQESQESEKKSFFARIKQKFAKPDVSEQGFEEVPSERVYVKKETEEKHAIPPEELEKRKVEATKKIEDKLKKKQTPTIQELAERKGELKKEIHHIKEELKEEKFEEAKEEITELKEEVEELEEKKGFFAKFKQAILTKKINKSQFNEIFWSMELVLLENNVAVEVIEKIKSDLESSIVDKPIPRGKTEKAITDSMRHTLEDLFAIEKINLLNLAKQKKPFVICFMGINGSGKTTTIAKIAKLFQQNKMSCVLAASDTFRAAAIDQLQQHADKLGVKLIKHDYGADAAAVAYDAISHAKAKGIDVVLIDTAGRMHSNTNLMDEMAKIVRVAKPDLKVFIGESITGNDCTEQARQFNESIGIDGIILSKADIDEKGGAAISISYVTGKPILYLGTGQKYSDLKEFEPNLIISSLGL